MSYVLCTNRGFLADWSNGSIHYTAYIEDAALFGPDAALAVQARLESCAILSTAGRLMLLSEVFMRLSEV